MRERFTEIERGSQRLRYRFREIKREVQRD